MNKEIKQLYSDVIKGYEVMMNSTRLPGLSRDLNAWHQRSWSVTDKPSVIFHLEDIYRLIVFTDYL